MNKTYIILMALPLMLFSGMARSQTVKDALAEIEKNNIAIRAANSTKEAKLIETTRNTNISGLNMTKSASRHCSKHRCCASTSS